jgi:hypothetical protein
MLAIGCPRGSKKLEAEDSVSWRVPLAALVVFPFLFSMGFVALGLYSVRLPNGNPLAFAAPAIFFATVCIGWVLVAVGRRSGGPAVGAGARAVPWLGVLSITLWIFVVIEVEPTLPPSEFRLPFTVGVLLLLLYATITAPQLIVGARRRSAKGLRGDRDQDEAWVPPMPPFG